MAEAWGNRRRWGRGQAVAVAVLLGVAQLAAVGWPAHACGCGALVPEEGSSVAVTQETSAVLWDGTTQEILMQLDVAGDAAEAAWIMPVPGRAEVALGDRAVFTHLDSLSGPEYRERHYFWPRAGDWPRSDGGDGTAGAAPPGDEGVDVVSRERLGPFDVAQLAASDPAALDNWLTDHGFPFPNELAEEVAPYVSEGWEFVAVRLAPGEEKTADGPGTQGPVLGGELDPLHLTFETETPVYPMRLSRLADTPQRLQLYILADHRTEPADTIGGSAPEVEFAGWLGDEGQLPEPVRDLAGGGRFLTSISQDFRDPEEITGDHELEQAAQDTEYREVIHRDRLLTWGGVPAWLIVTGGTALLVAGGSVVALRLRRSRPADVSGGP